MDSLIAQIIEVVLGVLSAALIGLVGVGIKWLTSKIKDEKIKGFFESLETVTETVVKGLEQTLVQELRAKTEDGKLSDGDIADLQQTALDEVCNGIPNAYIAAVQGQVDVIEDYVMLKIEAMVKKLKEGQ